MRQTGFEFPRHEKLLDWRIEIMKKQSPKKPVKQNYELDPDYSQAKPNRFAGRTRRLPVIVALAPDVAKVFKDGESVNAVLRSITRTLPHP